MADVKVPSGLDDPSHILDGINPDGLLGGIDLSTIGAHSGLDLLMDRADLGEAGSNIKAMAAGAPHSLETASQPPVPDYKVEAPDLGTFHFYPDRLETDHALLGEPRVQALMGVIREHEGKDYNVIVGGKRFDDYSRHPNIGAGKSHAAGAYQLQPGTWAPIQKDLHLPDFSPASQDLAAVDLLRQRGATDRLLAGDLDGAIIAGSHEWMGLPSSSEAVIDARGRTRGIDASRRHAPTFTLEQTRADYWKNLR